MKIRKELLALFGIFAAVLAFRLYFALKTATFVPESYFDIRQIIHVRLFDAPIFEDAMSYGGRHFFFLPLFHYLMAGFGLLFPLHPVLKLIPNIAASTIVIITYFISYELTKEKIPSLLAALASGLVPMFIFETVNSVSAYSFSIPLFFFMIYCMMRIEERKYVWLFLGGLLLLTFLDSLALLLMLGLLVYIGLVHLEQIKYNPAETELILFGTLLATGITFLIFKTPLLVHGPSVIWQNVPEMVRNDYFYRFSVLADVFMIGAIPFIAGLFIIYKYVLRQHEKDIYLFTGLVFATLALAWLKLINIAIGLIFLGILLSILFSQFAKMSLAYIANTRFSRYRNPYIALLFLALLATSGYHSAQSAGESVKDTLSENEVRALLWLKSSTEPDAVVAASLREGHLITGIAQRKNIADTNFLLVNDASQRAKDIETIYTTPYEIEAIRILNRYDTTYIFLSKRTVSSYGNLRYANDKNCFENMFENADVLIYKSLCKV